MTWRRSGDKPLFEPIMLNLLAYICVTRPQWVNKNCIPSPTMPQWDGWSYDKRKIIAIYFARKHHCVLLSLFVRMDKQKCVFDKNSKLKTVARDIPGHIMHLSLCQPEHHWVDGALKAHTSNLWKQNDAGRTICCLWWSLAEYFSEDLFRMM